MATIVLGLAATHGPLITTPPEGWENLGRQDMNDSRMDYEGLLRRAKPGIDAELTIEVKTRRYAACQSAIGTVRDLLHQAAPDVMVNVSNLHGDIRDNQQQVFGVYTGPTLSRPREAPHGPDFFRAQRQSDKAANDETSYPAHPELAQYLHERLNDRGFDVHACSGDPGIGYNYTFVYQLFASEGTLPMVPFMMSRLLPNQATPQRCYELGQALGEAIKAWPEDKRVVLMASGGLSHQVVDEELDRTVVKALVERDASTLCSLPRDRLNAAPGTPEILNWVTLSAAMGTPMTLVDYQPCYRSLAGTGAGVGFGSWQPSNA